MRRAFDLDEYNKRREIGKEANRALWENKEALDKYLKRLAELMAEDGDESAIQYMANIKGKEVSRPL